MRRALAPIALALAAACHSEAPASGPTPLGPLSPHAKPGPAAEDPVLPLPNERALADRPETLASGYWTSRFCGPRRYERRLQFTGDGRFEATDIPHPCPGECVVQWVVSRRGGFAMHGDAIALTVETTEDTMKQAPDTTPLPQTLTLREGAVAELLPDGTPCRYRLLR